MSAPFVYSPQSQYQPTPYFAGHHSPQHSPFIPDSTLYPSSPYTPVSSLPASPNLGFSNLPAYAAAAAAQPHDVLFPSENDFNYASTWDIPQRQRRPSWHGNVGTSTPMMQTQLLTAPIGYNRRHSFGAAAPQPAYSSPFTNNIALPSVAPQGILVHPWLNGENPRGDFWFNLSSMSFSPMRLYGPNQPGLLSLDDLHQSATHPPMLRMTITCDLIPQWPVTMEFDPYRPDAPAVPPPITLGDVLVAIHKSLHQRISHGDWRRLTRAEQDAVTRSYLRRCKSTPGGPTAQHAERSQGVRRVDFLLDKVWFRGLVRTGESWETLKMVVS